MGWQYTGSGSLLCGALLIVTPHSYANNGMPAADVV